MTQEDKQLLLKDLSARLPYNLYVMVEEFNIPKNETITEGFVGNYLKDSRCNDYDADDILNELADNCINVKPYLRLMSSMTEEEYNELKAIAKYYGFAPFEYIYDWCPNYEAIDWLNAHYFDYHGLIKKGLAIAVDKNNNPYKE